MMASALMERDWIWIKGISADKNKSGSKRASRSPGSLKKRKPGKSRRQISEANSLIVVPWAQWSDWMQVCSNFNEEKWQDVLSEILAWRQRVPALPIGVDSSLYLIQALLYDDPSNQTLNNDHSRSLYSLAVIRFVNHVSHLATKEMGGTSTLPMFQLASHVDVPEWIINLRHEASHGTALPSLEVLRIAASFMKTWLKENYWVIEDEPNSSSIALPTRAKAVNILSIEKSASVEARLLQQIRQHVSAFIASRIYKLRNYKTIRDSSIISILPIPSVNNRKTAAVVTMLKKKIEEFLKSEPAITCNVLATEMIPTTEFFKYFSGIFSNVDPFEQYCLVLNPLVKLFRRRLKLATVCTNLGEIHVKEDASRFCLQMSALWMNHLLIKIKELPKSSTGDDLAALLSLIIKSPNAYTRIFIDTLLELQENRLGGEKIDQIKKLVSIWCDTSSNFDAAKYKRLKGALPRGTFFTCADLEFRPSHFKTGSIALATKETVSPVASKDSMLVDVIEADSNERGSEFWKKIPFGTML